jgi:hypothetical protein
MTDGGLCSADVGLYVMLSLRHFRLARSWSLSLGAGAPRRARRIDREHILSDGDFTLVLANARHVKNVKWLTSVTPPATQCISLIIQSNSGLWWRHVSRVM